MKPFLFSILFVLAFTFPAFADDWDSLDTTLMSVDFISTYGDYETSVEIPLLAEKNYPGYSEVNPVMHRLFGTTLPSQPEYTLWFAGEYALEYAVARTLPVQWREAAIGVFIGVGALDVANNQLAHTSYGGQEALPFSVGNRNPFVFEKYNVTDGILFAGFLATEAINLMQDVHYGPTPGMPLSVRAISTAETTAVVGLISLVIPQRWRDALFGDEMGLNATPVAYGMLRR